MFSTPLTTNFLKAQPERTAMPYNNCTCWNKVLAPEMTTEFSPIFPATSSGKKNIPRALSTCCPYLHWPHCNDAVLPSLDWERAPPTAASCAIRGFCGISSIHLCSHYSWHLGQGELVQTSTLFQEEVIRFNFLSPIHTAWNSSPHTLHVSPSFLLKPLFVYLPTLLRHV